MTQQDETQPLPAVQRAPSDEDTRVLPVVTRHTTDENPVLVRPYILGETAPRTAPAWPQTPAPPAVPDADATIQLPRVPVAPTPPAPRSRRRATLALAGATTLAVAAAGLVVVLGLRHDEPRAPLAFHDVSLPPWSTAPSPTPVETGEPDDHYAPPGGDTIGGPVTGTGGRVTTNRTSAAASASAHRTKASATPSATATVRIGPIVGPGGLCLDLAAGNTGAWAVIQLWPCNNSTAQQWTLAGDGTLRVAGRCAAVDRGTLRLADCDGDSAATWQAGEDGTLVHVRTGQCLTVRFGSVRTQRCTGDAAQLWTLP